MNRIEDDLRIINLFNEGVNYFNKDQYDDALITFEKLLSIDNSHYGAWGYKGLSHGAIGNLNEALICFDNALEFNPDNHIIWYIKGNCYENMGNVNDAYNCYNKSIKIEPNYMPALEKKAFCLIKLQDYKMAVECFNKMLEFNPKDIFILHNKGCCYCSLNDFEKAMECFNKVLNIDNTFYQAWHGKGLCHMHQKQYFEALDCFDMAIDIDPYNETFYALQDKCFKEIETLKNKKFCPICSKEKNQDIAFCNTCGEKLISGLEYDVILKKRKKLENNPQFIQNLKIYKDAPKQKKLKKQYGIKICPVCKQEISKNAEVCVYCRTRLREYYNGKILQKMRKSLR